MKEKWRKYIDMTMNQCHFDDWDTQIHKKERNTHARPGLLKPNTMIVEKSATRLQQIDTHIGMHSRHPPAARKCRCLYSFHRWRFYHCSVEGLDAINTLNKLYLALGSRSVYARTLTTSPMLNRQVYTWNTNTLIREKKHSRPHMKCEAIIVFWKKRKIHTHTVTGILVSSAQIEQQLGAHHELRCANEFSRCC